MFNASSFWKSFPKIQMHTIVSNMGYRGRQIHYPSMSQKAVSMPADGSDELDYISSATQMLCVQMSFPSTRRQ